MTTRAVTAPPLRAIRDARPAGLAGVVAPSAALVDAASLRQPVQPVVPLLIAASALGFRLGAWR